MIHLDVLHVWNTHLRASFWNYTAGSSLNIIIFIHWAFYEWNGIAGFCTNSPIVTIILVLINFII